MHRWSSLRAAVLHGVQLSSGGIGKSMRDRPVAQGCGPQGAACSRRFSWFRINGLISRTYRLDQINDGFKAMMGGEVARGVVVFD